jgi:hypothetical protein
MPDCIYCGKPTRLFRRHHPECKTQFERATKTIPAFFEKLLHSNLPPNRFEGLLKEVAATFHIKSQQLKSLSVLGITAMLNAALQQRLPTPQEEARILEVAAGVGVSLEDMPDLEEKLVKIGALRDLDEDLIPDRVKVVGAMPLEFGPGERVVWIFNNVGCYREGGTLTVSKIRRDPAHLQRQMPPYIPPSGIGNKPTPTKKLFEIGSGDLVVTNHNLFVVLTERQPKFPLFRFTAIDTYNDGVQMSRAYPDERPAVTFVVDDPWFAANLFVRLLRLRRKHRGELQEVTAIL